MVVSSTNHCPIFSKRLTYIAGKVKQEHTIGHESQKLHTGRHMYADHVCSCSRRATAHYDSNVLYCRRGQNEKKENHVRG
jgi:hypothetical protein